MPSRATRAPPRSTRPRRSRAARWASIASTSSRAASAGRGFDGTLRRTGLPSGASVISRRKTRRQVTRWSDVHRLVEPVGRLRDRARDAAGCLVAGDRERGALAAEPRLDERVRQVGERPGSPAASRRMSSASPASSRRPARRAGCSMASRSAAGAIGPTRCTPSATSGARSGCPAQSSRKSERTTRTTVVPFAAASAIARAAASTSASPAWNTSSNWSTTTTSARRELHTASRIRTSRSCSGVRIATRSPRRRQRGDHARAHERRLPAARRTGHGEETRAGDSSERCVDVGIPPEELVLVLDAERLQPSIRAGRAGDRPAPRRGRGRRRGAGWRARAR